MSDPRDTDTSSPAPTEPVRDPTPTPAPAVEPSPPEPVSDVEAEQPLPEARSAPPPEPPATEDITPAAGGSTATEDITPADTAEPKPPRKRRDVVLDVLVVSTVVLLIATILLGLMAFAPQIAPIKSGPTRLAVQAMEERDILDVARRFARNFLTINFRTIDSDIKRLTADATGDFKDQISEVLRLSREQFEKREATSQGKVNEAVLLFHEDDTARVQVLAERTIRNAKTKEAEEQPQPKVLDIALVQTPGGWKVDNVREVQVQGES